MQVLCNFFSLILTFYQAPMYMFLLVHDYMYMMTESGI